MSSKEITSTESKVNVSPEIKKSLETTPDDANGNLMEMDQYELDKSFDGKYMSLTEIGRGGRGIVFAGM